MATSNDIQTGADKEKAETLQERCAGILDIAHHAVEVLEGVTGQAPEPQADHPESVSGSLSVLEMRVTDLEYAVCRIDKLARDIDGRIA